MSFRANSRARSRNCFCSSLGRKSIMSLPLEHRTPFLEKRSDPLTSVLGREAGKLGSLLEIKDFLERPVLRQRDGLFRPSKGNLRRVAELLRLLAGESQEIFFRYHPIDETEPKTLVGIDKSPAKHEVAGHSRAR